MTNLVYKIYYAIYFHLYVIYCFPFLITIYIFFFATLFTHFTFYFIFSFWHHSYFISEVKFRLWLASYYLFLIKIKFLIIVSSSWNEKQVATRLSEINNVINKLLDIPWGGMLVFWRSFLWMLELFFFKL
jgi:hypothetical protein